ALEELEPRAVRQHDIREDHVRLPRLDRTRRLARGGSGAWLETPIRDPEGEDFAHCGFVVDHEDFHTACLCHKNPSGVADAGSYTARRGPRSAGAEPARMALRIRCAAGRRSPPEHPR